MILNVGVGDEASPSVDVGFPPTTLILLDQEKDIPGRERELPLTGSIVRIEGLHYMT